MKIKAILLFGIIVPITVAAAGCGAARDGATVRESREVFRTYPFAGPDPVPIFARSGMRGLGERLYPYFFFTQFSRSAVDRDWTVVRLENPHISVAVLPETGGKVWGASDKASGREFIYTNKVMKFREIALRGPWTSGGIEFNFGVVGHAPTTATPVDYLLRENADGSAVCYVGALDLPSRTRWTVAVTLPPDAAAFETNAFWHNPTPFSQSYYAWSCAAIGTADDLKYIFPGRWFIGHDYHVPLEPWPVDRRGRDLSWYRNNAFPDSKSYFTVGERADFYGAWYADSDSGFGHWSPYEEMPGRKVWIWDLSRSGGIWEDLLTDADGQYTEPQSGRLLNQSDHDLFPPGRSDRWREAWFLYGGIGPLTEASARAAVHVSAEDGALRVGLCALRPIDDDLVVRAGGREVFRERLRLGTGKVLKTTIAAAIVAPGHASDGVTGGTDAPGGTPAAAIEVRLGAELLYASDPEAGELRRPLRFRAVEDKTAEALFRAGLGHEKERLYGDALAKYAACLEKEPAHVRALARTAEILTRRGLFDQAIDFAGRALETSMYDPEANYVYGVAARRRGRLVDAKETLGWAARSMEYRSAAYTRLAEISMLEEDFDGAADYARKALDANADNSAGLEVLAAAHRKAGRVKAAGNAVARLLEIDPLNHAGRFETYLLSPSQASWEAFRSMIRWEMPHETCLEIAARYAGMGLEDDAAALLRKSPEHPVVLAWLAWILRDSAPEESAKALDSALALSPELVFPFREESIPVFAWAAERRPDDWKPKFYLGLIYWGKGRLDEARVLFERCGDTDYGAFHIARAELRSERPEAALADLERAVDIDAGRPGSWCALAEFHLRRGNGAEARRTARRAAALFPEETAVQVAVIKSDMAIGDWADAAAVIDALEALPYEGASEIHALFVRTHVQLGLAAMRTGNWSGAIESFRRSRDYPESLGTGAPFDPDYRLQDWFEAICRERLGDRAGAEERRRLIYEYTTAHREERRAHDWFGALALEARGDRDKARELRAAAPEPPADIRAMALRR